MPEVSLSDIKVGKRFRKKFDDIDKLADSIKQFGLIEPIIIDENHNLIAGERRFKAHQLLKRKVIEAKFIKDLSSVEKKEIELEENIQRADFTWQEEVAAKEELHSIKQKLHGKATQGHSSNEAWGLKETAEALGLSTGSVSMDIKLAKALVEYPELKKEKNKKAAYKKLRMLEEQMLTQELLRRHKVMAKSKGEKSKLPVFLGDCTTILKTFDSDSIDLVLTDPPYGINIENSQVFKRMSPVTIGFKDDLNETMELLDKAIKELYRVLKNNRHLYLFFATETYQQTRNLLEKHGFSVHPMPIIWDKGSGSYPSQSTSFVHSYEPFLHASKGQRKLNGTPRDVFQIKRADSKTKTHPTQKPIELLSILIELSTLPDEVVLDPFAGSGSTLFSARELKRKFLGIEINPVYYDEIINSI